MFEYQNKLDDARERFDNARTQTGDDAMTDDFLSGLDAEIDAAMPERVQRIMGQPGSEHTNENRVDGALEETAQLRQASAPGFTPFK